MVTIFFRYDDYSSLSHPTVDRGVIDIFGRHQVSCTFAVVPAITALYPAVEGSNQDELPLSQEKNAELREAVRAGTVDLALHGWRHLANQFTCHPDPSEFRGLSVEEQAKILQRGRDFLADAVGAPPTLFVPPWNSYDANTVKALEMSGFRGISASRYSPRPESSGEMAFAPYTAELGEMRSAIDAARRSGEDSPVVGIMMHPYDFIESDDKRAIISLQKFEQEVRWLKEQPDVRILPISAVLASGIGMDRQRFLANRPSALEDSYPPVVARVASDLVYHTTPGARRSKLRRNSLFVGILLVLMLLGGVSGWFAESLLLKWHPPLVGAVPYVALLAMVLLGTRAVRAGAIYTRGAALMAALLGVFVHSMV
jgi:peptidoglycan/xylan/chitin deacetylase (PgdA/CDA1 family)